MEIVVLVGQRTQRYEGEYAPEALAVIDGIGHEDNPDYMASELDKQKQGGEFDALAVVRLAVSDEAIDRALYPVSSEIPAKILA